MLSRAAQLDYVVRIAEAMPYIRNHIARGRPAAPPPGYTVPRRLEIRGPIS
jgi:hypothetical protein